LVRTVDPALAKARAAAVDELRKLMKDKRGHAISYNHYFIDVLQKLQRERLMAKVQETIKTMKLYFSNDSSGLEVPKNDKLERYVKPDDLVNGLQNTLQVDMTKVAAEQALDALQAYYKVQTFCFDSLLGIATNISRTH
jgi:hypothetical protein